MVATKRKAGVSDNPATVRRSKLAKEHNITAAEEDEIKEAFSLFAEARKGEKEGVIPIDDVRRAMVALNIPPTKEELPEFISILDPDSEGYSDYPSFLAICALKLHTRTHSSEAHAQEVDEAWALFMAGGSGIPGKGKGRPSAVDELLYDGEEKITLTSLKRVAKALKEDVDEALLRDMILEANGGQGVGKGVDKEEFEAVMRRAGVWR